MSLYNPPKPEEQAFLVKVGIEIARGECNDVLEASHNAYHRPELGSFSAQAAQTALEYLREQEALRAKGQ